MRLLPPYHKIPEAGKLPGAHKVYRPSSFLLPRRIPTSVPSLSDLQMLSDPPEFLFLYKNRPEDHRETVHLRLPDLADLYSTRRYSLPDFLPLPASSHTDSLHLLPDAFSQRL